MLEARELNPEPFIILAVSSSANCEMIENVRRTMNQTTICADDGLCGEGTGWRQKGLETDPTAKVTARSAD